MISQSHSFQLTSREKHVLHLLAEGHTFNQISYILGIAQTTVITHVERMKSKLEVCNSVELIYITAKIGLQCRQISMNS